MKNLSGVDAARFLQAGCSCDPTNSVKPLTDLNNILTLSKYTERENISDYQCVHLLNQKSRSCHAFVNQAFFVDFSSEN